MKKLITKIKLLKLSMMTIVVTLGMLSVKAQPAPWCDGFHAYQNSTYGYSATSYIVALEQVRISVGSSVIFNMPGDAFSGSTTCGQEWRLANSPAKAFDMTAGSTYTVEASSSSSFTFYSGVIGVFIDFNNDKDFLDAGEYLGTFSNPNSVGAPSALGSRTFTIPCNVTPSATRMRVVCNYNGFPMTASYGCSTCGGAPYYGETADFSINLVLPTSVSANFVVPNQIWVKTVVKFINSNQSGYTEHAWDANNDGSWEQKGVTANYSSAQMQWTAPGNKCVKLRSTNCLGKDSIVKCFAVNAPTAVPEVDFVADKVTVAIYESIKLYDLSTNGPSVWRWDVYDSTTYASSNFFPRLIDDNLNGGEVLSDPWGATPPADEFSQNPEFAFDYPGCYTVEMICKNDVGQSDVKKKVCYITVTLPTQYNLGYGSYGPNNDNIVGSTSGTIFDYGGPDLPYRDNEGLGSRAFLQITPCNAKKIELTMTRLKFKDAADKLSVWDGMTAGGAGSTLLAQWSGPGIKVPQKVVATSGSMYILFESDGSGIDSGFAGSYTSELGPATIATPSFTPSSVPSYNSTPVKFTNTTSGIVGVPTWEWTIDGNQPPDNKKKDFNYTFYTGGQYDVCVEIKSCVGNNKSCTTINVISPSQQTLLDFNASLRRPNINVDITTLYPVSDNANRFEWTIFPTTYTLMNPPGAPSSYGAGFIKYNATPGDTIPKPRIKFTAPGCYTISLKAYNSLNPTVTTKTVVKNKFICALDYCNPTAYIISGDVGINRVRLIDNNIDLINNYTSSGINYYTDYSSTIKAGLTYGKKYTVEVSRNSSVDPANRKIWIDWNIDGDFNDADEEITSEASTYNQVLTYQFEVPALSASFEGLTKMRVAINYNNENTTPCGPLTAGEYEDYGLILANDNQPPVITMNGKDTVWIEVNSTYTDAKATAWDPSEGDITNVMITTTDLDATVTGLYTVEYNVTDKSGNKAVPAIRTIIVVNDLTPPVLTLNPGNSGCIEVDRLNPPYIDPGATATGNTPPYNLTSSIIVTGFVDTRTIGVYTLTYYVQDVAGNSTTKTRNVCVEDNTAPIIRPLGETNIQIGSVWIDQTTVEDYDLDPDFTRTWWSKSLNTLERGTYSATYEAVDESGNIATPEIRHYRVDDFIPPVINLNTFDIVHHEVRTAYNSMPATVTDNLYTTGQVSIIKIFSNVNANVLGTYTEIFEAIDGSGNMAQKTRTVIVEDTKAPSIWGEIIHGCVGTPIWPMWGISTKDNYYSPARLKDTIEIVNQNVNMWVAGLYSITYRVTDPSGNTSDEFTRMVSYTYWPDCINSSIGIDQVKTMEESVSVYPNPSNGLVTLDLNGLLARKATIEVYNAMGQVIQVKEFTEATGKFDIDLTGNASGIYTIRLLADGHIITKRVVIQ